jgi:small subunit ribosomal protein S7
MNEILAFNKWSTKGIAVKDPGLKEYINLNPTFIPRTGARYAGSKFYKSRVFIVERLINRLMVPGHKAKKHKLTSYLVTGKSATATKIVEQAFKIIESKMKKNPVEVLAGAVENSAPREEIITIEYGGARYPKAVEMAPQRRVDFALKMMTQSAYQKTRNSKKTAVNALADEIMAAYMLSPNSMAISKKLELERQADASR